MVRRRDQDAAADSCACSRIPGGLFILTAQYESRRGALLVKWVQQCSDQPPMVMVAMPRGQQIEPLIHNSRAFALCQISAEDRFLLRKFTQHQDNGEDPLVTLMTRTGRSGSPIVDRALAYFDCEIVRHLELDSDYRIYVGQVLDSAMLNEGAPAVCFGGNGFTPGH
jgi:flavin reductase (DIM6/NTAB) family NADH-FMN oxidoreductase RutF